MHLPGLCLGDNVSSDVLECISQAWLICAVPSFKTSLVLIDTWRDGSLSSWLEPSPYADSQRQSILHQPFTVCILWRLASCRCRDQC